MKKEKNYPNKQYWSKRFKSRATRVINLIIYRDRVEQLTLKYEKDMKVLKEKEKAIEQRILALESMENIYKIQLN